ncbi:MAG: diacylglycerol/lipid kinase family protein [Ruminococcus sp.]
MQHLFIINKTAGKNDSYLKVTEQLEKLKLENITVKYTSCKGDATNIARDFVKNSDDFVNIYSCGGDGTLNEVVNGIYDLDNCAVAPVPIGSGNDFIRSFEVSKEDFLNIDKLIKGTSKSVDLIKCNDKICTNSVNIGFDCAVAKNVDIFKKWPLITSSFAYKLSVVYCLISKRKHNFEIYADNSLLPMKSTYLLSVSAKGKYYGGGIKCAPYADNMDGFIDFMFIDSVGILKFLSFFSSFVKGEHINDSTAEFVYHNKFKEIEYKSKTPIEIGVDGEIFAVTDAKISVLKDAVKIIIP